MADAPASRQIDAIIKDLGDWRGEVVRKLRDLITRADPDIVEEVKWKMPSRPEGLPVWSLNGNVCMAEAFKSHVKLTFFKGARMKDSKKLFNSRLMSKTDRAIDFREGDSVDEPAVTALVREAVKLNR